MYNFNMQHVHSVNSQTLQQCSQNVEMPPLPNPRLPPCPVTSYCHQDKNQKAWTSKEGSSLSPHVYIPLTAAGSRARTIH
jgi:hypothetical protein